MDFSKLNSVARCETPLGKSVKAADLGIGTAHRISDVRRVETRFGPSVIVVLEDLGDLFLPRRFAKTLTPEACEALAGASIKLLGFKSVGAILTPLYEFIPGS